MVEDLFLYLLSKFCFNISDCDIFYSSMRGRTIILTSASISPIAHSRILKPAVKKDEDNVEAVLHSLHLDEFLHIIKESIARISSRCNF